MGRSWRPMNQRSMIEVYNPSSQPVKLLGQDKKVISIPPMSKVIVPSYFAKYAPKMVQLVRFVGSGAKPTPRVPPYLKKAKRIQRDPPKPAAKTILTTPSRNVANNRLRTLPRRSQRWRNRNVGRAIIAGAAEAYAKIVNDSCVPISNHIGVGILSYNRFDSLKRLITSIKHTTDLKRTTVIVSDESDKLTADQKNWLLSQDITVLFNEKRIGIAGNTNRLLKCLDRFKYKLILNDDVEILNPGWDRFYFDNMAVTGVQHFCYREPGVYGAREADERQIQINGVKILKVNNKPQGGVLALTQDAFLNVGFFDESFGTYGMEHVDWSTRYNRKYNQDGFMDVQGSQNYFKLHDQQSSVPDRGAYLSKAKQYFASVNSNPNRVYVSSTQASDVPAISVVIPFRDAGRLEDLETVVGNMRAQRFPRIEIIVAEQDADQKARLQNLSPITYIKCPHTILFNKSLAFNTGVSKSKNPRLVLHDADIIATGDYLQSLFTALNTHESCHLGKEVYYLDEDSTNKLNTTCSLHKNYKCSKIVTYFEGGSLGCTKDAYIKAGGFDEGFEGYGVEDCAFYENISKLSTFCNDRKFKFFHLWHGRVGGWEECHERNKSHYSQMLKRHHTLSNYAAYLSQQYKAKYSGNSSS